MHFFRSSVCLLLLITTPVSFLHAHKHHSKHHHSKKRSKSIVQEKGIDDLHLWTYDEILRFLDEVESGKVEKNCSLEECAKIDRFLVLLAKEGESSGKSSLNRDIAELVPEKQSFDANPLALRMNFGDVVSSTMSWIRPEFASYFALKTSSSHTSNWKKTKKFIHKHRKAIIIGIVVVVVVVTVVTIVVLTGSSAAAGAVSAVGTAVASNATEHTNDPPSRSDLKEVLDEQIESIKYTATEHDEDPLFSNNARELGSIAAHDSLQRLPLTNDNEFKHDVIDHEFSTNFSSYYADGKLAFEEYERYEIQERESSTLSILEFSEGFSKGLPVGVRDSGADMINLATDLTTHPIRTTVEIYGSLKELSELARSGEWKDVSQTLTPEVYELVTEWDNLSSLERGNLTGYAVGKYGADIIIPGAAGKVIARGAKAGKILRNVRNSCEIAERTLVLESAAGLESAQKIGQALEMSQLKQAGKLEGAISNGLERFVSQSESEVLKTAISKNRNVKFIQDYLTKPTKEIQKGVNSYEKQIAIHQEKISNPSKFIPNWDELHPERKGALINKKWPAEIKLYTEQKEALQSILNERFNYNYE